MPADPQASSRLPSSAGSIERRGEIAAFVHQLGPAIEDLFLRLGLSEPEAEEVLREVLPLLAYHWETVCSRETWLLTTLERHGSRRRVARVQCGS